MTSERLSNLEDRLEGLERRLAGIETRLDSLNDALAVLQDSRPDLRHPPLPTASTAGARDSAAGIVVEPSDAGPSTLTLIGRLLLFLGGGFLLRGGTDAGTFSPVIGVTLGLAYGALQMFLAARSGTRGSRAAANWFGLGAALVLLPLIVESTLKFRILSPTIAAMILPVIGISGVIIAVRAQLRMMAWTFLAGSGSAGLLLGIKTGMGLGFPLGVLLLGLCGLWLGYLRRWYALAVVGSFVPLALVMMMTVLVALDLDPDVASSLTPGTALVMQLGLIAGFLGSFLARVLRWSRPVSVPEITQAALAMLIGFAGSLVSLQKDPALSAIIGSFAVFVGLGAYVISFLRIDRAEGSRVNFAFFSSVALVGTLAAGGLVLHGWVRVGLFVVAAIGFALAGARWNRPTLSLHAAIYVIGAGFASGLVALSLGGMFGIVETLPPRASLVPMGVVAATAVLCCFIPVARGGRTWGRFSRMPNTVEILFLIVVIDGLLSLITAAWLTTGPDGSPDAGIVAAMRTGVLAISAMLVALGARSDRFRESVVLVPVVLVLGGMALLLGDLREGRPVTQFVSFALYGLALILAPKLARQAKSLQT